MKFIAELCQNHNGDIDTMIKMVQAASKVGATHIKLQHIFAENLSFRPQFENGLEIDGKTICIKRPYQTEYDRLKKLELDNKAVQHFITECNNLGVIPTTTCFSRQHVKILYDLGFRSIKVASYDCSSFQLLRDLSKYDWEIIVSTGSSYDSEIKKASKILSSTHDFSLLHCITIYPTPLYELNLNRMNFLKKLCKNVGFSDHTLIKKDGVKASIAAIFLGAQIIERHFTILEPDKTKDGPVSTNPEEFAEITKFAKLNQIEKDNYIETNLKDIKDYLGTDTRQLSHAELLNRDYYRGRFASINHENPIPEAVIYNWEEVDLS